MPVSLKEILDSLPPEDLSTLEFALSIGAEHFIRLKNNHYIGVFSQQNPNLIPEMESGNFSYGKIKQWRVA
jgi:hypothetical protein